MGHKESDMIKRVILSLSRSETEVTLYQSKTVQQMFISNKTQKITGCKIIFSNWISQKLACTMFTDHILSICACELQMTHHQPTIVNNNYHTKLKLEFCNGTVITFFKRQSYGQNPRAFIQILHLIKTQHLLSTKHRDMKGKKKEFNLQFSLCC